MPYIHVGRDWLNRAARAISDKNATTALELVAPVVSSDHRDVLSTLGVANLVSCCECIHYIPDPDPVDPGWPMMCEETGRDMVEPYGTCYWGVRKSDCPNHHPSSDD